MPNIAPKSRFSLYERLIASSLILLHLVTFGPSREAIAYSAQSASYKLNAGAMNEGGKARGVSHTTLLLHADGADDSSVFSDEAGKPVTAQGNAQIDIAQSKFGGASGLFDGAGDYLSIPDSDDWNFGSGDFTIDFWMRLNTSQTNRQIISQLDQGGGTSNSSWSIFLNTTNLEFQYTTTGLGNDIIAAQFSTTWVSDTWYHIAIVRNGAELKAYSDGVQIGSTYDISTTTLYNSTKGLYVGAGYFNGVDSNYFNGLLDEVRISKGIARWTSNFTPPQEPYTINSSEPNTIKLWQDSIGEPAIGRATSASYVLNAGLIAILQTNPPTLTQDIPYQSWQINTVKTNAFDLDDYFSSDIGGLSYTVSGNSQISVSIDPDTHQVSFSQTTGWTGIEKVYFTATDSEGNSTQSNKVSLQVENPLAQDSPVIVDVSTDPSTIKEGDLITLTVKAKDLDNDTITFSYNQFFSQITSYQQDGYWYSQATWQTSSSSKGHYQVTVTAKDTNNLSDSYIVTLNVGNTNNPPVLSAISPITKNEGDTVVITSQATDSDNDAISYYYSSPFDSTGKWLTDYDDAGSYSVKVTASDGIDTVFQDVSVTIQNTNRAPSASLSLSKYTLNPNEEISITLTASDSDNDAMTYVLKKDATQIASGSVSSTTSTIATTSFADIGDHTISVTVTDSGGLTATDTVNVDVVDPNTNKEAINPVMGDFNGDALTDLGLHNSDTGTWEVAISDKGNFTAAVDWLTNFGTTRDWQPVGGDFNGDARTDVGIYNSSSGEFKIATSSGTALSAQGTWLTVSFASSSWQLFTGNFNADKYTDIALYNRDTGEIRVALGTGSSFESFNTWLSNASDTGYIAMSGDFNADSLSDLCLFKKITGEFKVAFSNSKSLVDESSWITGYATDKDPLLSDFNNDGLTDIGYWDKASYTWDYAISTGDKFISKGTWLLSFGQTTDDSATTGDFDGNGITDAATFDRDKTGIDRWTTRLNSTTKPADLLTEVDNSIGGKTQISYTYASASDNSELPFPVYVTQSVTVIDSKPSTEAEESYTQNFSYSGGYFDSGEREFRGFKTVKATDPITNNYSQTYFYQGRSGQDGALKGQIEKIISYDGNGKRISQTLNTYEVRKSGPEANILGFPALTQTETTVWEENETSITTRSSLSYDNIGNLIEGKDEGDIAKTGDEKSSVTSYNQAYTIGYNRPKEALLKDKDANTISKKSFEYDDKGNLSAETIEINSPLTGELASPTIRYTYDSFGNLISSTNALEKTVTTDYETTYYTYPERTTNSLSHSVSYTYEPKFGVVKSTTDANGVVAESEYDSLARPTRTLVNTQTKATYSYPDFNTKISTNAIGLSSTEYIDGLGRKYKTISVGEDGSSSRQVSTEVYYNNRGMVERESLAHYIDESASNIAYVRYEYDIRGRVKKTIADFPGTTKDTESLVNYIDPLQTEATDPKGHRKATKKDVYGNIEEVIEYAGTDGVFHTYYEYDTQGNLLKTTDNQGNITQLTYDSIGRKLKMIDPDMGTWNYEYDIIGNLKKQTDAKGQVLEFEYDDLNRLTRKLANSQTLVTYLYDDSTKLNCIGRLSKVTDQSGSTEFFYDSLGREIKSIKTVGTVSYTVQRQYDTIDRLTKLTYPDNTAVNYGYDTNSGLLERVYSSNGPLTTYYVNSITYNAQGQMRATTYGNGTSTTYAYGQDLRLSRILTSTSASTLQDLNYIFDKNGNLQTLTDNLRSNIRSYSYDNLDRLTQADNIPDPNGGYTTFSYQYDSIGNTIYKSDVGVMNYGASAGPHALTSAGGYSYTYDANGNMVTGKNKTMAYDVENRLTSVDGGLLTEDYMYDGDGGRVKKSTVNGQQTTETIYIGSLYEKDSDGTIRKHIFAGSNRIATVSLRGSEATEAISYYHSDHLGSSNVITDATGAQVQYCEYTPYGTTARNEGSDLVKHKFTGKELDSTGLYYYGARYYDPELGRFITADTIVQAPYDPQSFNRYSYCRNNPINYVDPTGHWFWFVAAIIIGAVTGGVSAATSGASIGMGILMGALGGAMIAGGALGASALWGSAWAWAGAAVGGAASGAANAGAFGGNVGTGVLAGAIGAGIGCGVGYGVGQALGPFLGAVAGGLAGGIAGGGLGAELNGSDFWQGAGMGAAYGVAGALAGYGAAKAFAPRTTQSSQEKGTQQLKTDQKPSGNKYRLTTNYDEEGQPVSYNLLPDEIPQVGAKVYRVFDNRPYGRSWTPIDPRTVPNYADKSGMYNKGRFLIEGTLRDASGVISKPADPGPYGNGGLTEWVIPDPNAQIKMDNVYGLNPEFGE